MRTAVYAGTENSLADVVFARRICLGREVGQVSCGRCAKKTTAKKKPAAKKK